MQSDFHKIVLRNAWVLVLFATSVFAQTQPYAPSTGRFNSLVVFVLMG